MQPHPLAAVVGDIDRQYLANIRHLRHKIAQVQHDQREISLCLERIRSRVRILIVEMQRVRPAAGYRS